MEFLSNNLMLVTLVFLSGSMLLWSFVGNRLRGVTEVDSLGALQMINHKDAFVLDVREKVEFEAGHILNAKHLPLGKLMERMGEIEKYRNRPVVVVCRGGHRSATAVQLLNKQGFSQAISLAGGVVAWQKANLPLEK